MVDDGLGVGPVPRQELTRSILPHTCSVTLHPGGGVSFRSRKIFAATDWRHSAIGQWFDGFVRGEERLELVWSPSGTVAPGLTRPGSVSSEA